MPTDIANVPPTSSGGGAATLPSTLVLADATTTTAPDLLVLQHTTSGTAAAGFGETSAVELESGAGTTRRVMTDVTLLVTATDGAEVARRDIQLMVAGALAKIVSFGTDAIATPTLFMGDPAENVGLRHSAANRLDLIINDAAYVQMNGGVASIAVNLTCAQRLLEKQGAAVASASTLTLGSDGNYFHITGTTTINYITTTGWQAGARIGLYFNSAALTVTNNAGSVPGGTNALQLSGAVNITTTADLRVDLRLDSTQSKWVEISRST